MLAPGARLARGEPASGLKIAGHGERGANSDLQRAARLLWHAAIGLAARRLCCCCDAASTRVARLLQRTQRSGCSARSAVATAHAAPVALRPQGLRPPHYPHLFSTPPHTRIRVTVCARDFFSQSTQMSSAGICRPALKMFSECPHSKYAYGMYGDPLGSWPGRACGACTLPQRTRGGPV